MLYLAWRYGGEDPYCLYNGLTVDYRPLEDPSAERRPPRFPTRLKLFKYGLGLFATEQASERRNRQPREEG